MLSPLSVVSLDQGPKWRDPAAEPAKAEAPGVSSGRLVGLLRWLAGRLSRRPAPSRYPA